jgi:hypothetical protein
VISSEFETRSFLDPWLEFFVAPLMDSWPGWRLVPVLGLWVLFVGQFVYVPSKYLAATALCELGGAALLVGSVLIFNYSRAIKRNIRVGRGWRDVPTPPEPAFRNYFFLKASKDLRFTLLNARLANYRVVRGVGRATLCLFANSTLPITWFIAICIAPFIVLACVGAILLCLVFALFHLTVVALSCFAAILAAGLMRSAELAWMSWRRIFLICPNARCYRHIALPIYLCSQCQAEHKRLIPGAYGIWKRRCECGNKLGTLTMSGRSDLTSLCPFDDCHKPLPLGIETRRAVHVSLVGAPNSGKSTLLAAMLYDLFKMSRTEEIALQVPQPRQRRRLKDFEDLLTQGQFPDKTVDRFPEAFVVYIQDLQRNRIALNVYDPAGETYVEATTIRQQRFQSVVEAVFFLVDPLAVKVFIMDFEGEQNTPAAVRGGDPEAAYSRFATVFNDAQKGKDAVRDTPFALVVTKSDILGDFEGDPRAWLNQYGMGNLVRSIENDFSRVNYFFSTVYPDSSSVRFGRASVPLQWLLSFEGVHFRSPGWSDPSVVGDSRAAGGS